MLDPTIGFTLWRSANAPRAIRFRREARRDTPSRLRAHSAEAISEFNEGDFSVDDEQILDIVHQTAAGMMAANDDELVEYGSAVSTEDADSLIDRYGFSSIDLLKFLLILEEKFGITLADENLDGEVFSSATVLAKHIATLRETRKGADVDRVSL
jgi:acyl carrier protein